MPAERVIYETLNRLSSRFSVWVLRLDVRRTRSTAAQFSSADRLILGSLSRHMLVMPVARMPKNVRFFDHDTRCNTVARRHGESIPRTHLGKQSTAFS